MKRLSKDEQMLKQTSIIRVFDGIYKNQELSSSPQAEAWWK